VHRVTWVLALSHITRCIPTGLRSTRSVSRSWKSACTPPCRSSLGDSGAIGVPFSGESPPPLSAFKPNSSLCYDRQLILDLFFMAALEIVVVPGAVVPFVGVASSPSCMGLKAPTSSLTRGQVVARSDKRVSLPSWTLASVPRFPLRATQICSLPASRHSGLLTRVDVYERFYSCGQCWASKRRGL
jgi:hypothetical protein